MRANFKNTLKNFLSVGAVLVGVSLFHIGQSHGQILGSCSDDIKSSMIQHQYADEVSLYSFPSDAVKVQNVFKCVRKSVSDEVELTHGKVVKIYPEVCLGEAKIQGEKNSSLLVNFFDSREALYKLETFEEYSTVDRLIRAAKSKTVVPNYNPLKAYFEKTYVTVTERYKDDFRMKLHVTKARLLQKDTLLYDAEYLCQRDRTAN